MKRIAEKITGDRLRELLTYVPELGAFVWAKSRPKCRMGDIAGGLDKDGYWRIGIDGDSTLVWLWYHDRLPEEDIDHWDRDRKNDRFANLRAATRRENIANSGKKPNNRSGFKGVSYHPQSGRWTARIRLRPGDRSGKHLGMFDAPEHAAAAYRVAATEMYGDFARAE